MARQEQLVLLVRMGQQAQQELLEAMVLLDRLEQLV
jgi:hypothetical protein